MLELDNRGNPEHLKLQPARDPKLRNCGVAASQLPTYNYTLQDMLSKADIQAVVLVTFGAPAREASCGPMPEPQSRARG